MNIEDRVRILELRITTIESALIELGNKDLLVKTMQDILKNVQKEVEDSEMGGRVVSDQVGCDPEGKTE